MKNPLIKYEKSMKKVETSAAVFVFLEGSLIFAAYEIVL
jgi:hypothetical protein